MMTTDRQIKVVARAIREAEACATFSHPHYEELAKAAIEASDAKYVPMLVEALSELVKVKYIKDTHGKCDDYLRRVSPAWEAARGALSQLPSELRG